MCKIPHGTFDTKRISDYCVAFAKERGLEVEQDEANDCLLYTSYDAFLGKEIDYSAITPGSGAGVGKMAAPQEAADIKFGYCTEFRCV